MCVTITPATVHCTETSVRRQRSFCVCTSMLSGVVEPWKSRLASSSSTPSYGDHASLYTGRAVDWSIARICRAWRRPCPADRIDRLNPASIGECSSSTTAFPSVCRSASAPAAVAVAYPPIKLAGVYVCHAHQLEVLSRLHS